MPLHRIDGSDHGCAIGAARLARACIDGDLAFAKPRRLRTHEPDPRLAAQYDASHAQWQSLYGLLRQVPPQAIPSTPVRDTSS